MLANLETRFHANMHRHTRLTWSQVQERLNAHPKKIKTIEAMEATGGEPDVVGITPKGEIIFMDCAAETPTGRRSLCYDQKALNERKENKPAGAAVEAAKEMGAELLNEADYRYLQALVTVDQKTSTWLKTPDNIRALGGAIFGDYRYGTVFIYHNGVQSYYAARGFRCKLIV